MVLELDEQQISQVVVQPGEDQRVDFGGAEWAGEEVAELYLIPEVGCTVEPLVGNDGFVNILVDSGAFEHVCPMSFGDGWESSEPRQITAAGGQDVKHFGARRVPFMIWGKIKAVARFEVCKVTRPILSVGSLLNQGVKAIFDKEKSMLTLQDAAYPLVRIRNIFFLPVKVEDSRALESATEEDFDADDIDMEEEPLGGISEDEGEPEGLQYPEDDEEDPLLPGPMNLPGNDHDKEKKNRSGPKVKQPPIGPSPAQWHEHQATHLPYQAWCRMCVENRGRDRAHAQVQRDDVLPRVELDYSFVKLGLSERTVPVLIVTYTQRQYGMAAIMRAKGREDPR